MNSLTCLVALSSVALLASSLQRQQSTPIDPVAASPRQFTVPLENEHVRVVEYTLRPGERDHWRTHPPKVSYVVSGGALRIHMSDTTAVMAPVRDFVERFNKGDATTSRTGCRFVTSIIDDFPPHEWHGAGACARWMQSYRVYTKANGLADMIIALGSPSHVNVTAGRAYVVIPASYTIEVHGTLVNKRNSIVTFALERSANEWHIIGWSWADG